MRPSSLILLLLAWCWATSANPSAPDAARDYLRLADWAQSNQVQVLWLKKYQTLQLNHRSNRILLTINSREARVNGVQVWLSQPVLVRAGRVSIPQLDAAFTLAPLLTPRTRLTPPIRTICLDPGHGGKDPGYRVDANEEKKYTLLTILELRELLQRSGFRVILTRGTDTFIDLPTRPAIARRGKADLFVSLHFNATGLGGADARGAEVYCLTPAGASSTNTRGEAAERTQYPGNAMEDR